MRVRAPSFVRAELTWDTTVLSPTPSVTAICGAVCPAATSSSTSTSRRERRARWCSRSSSPSACRVAAMIGASRHRAATSAAAHRCRRATRSSPPRRASSPAASEHLAANRWKPALGPGRRGVTERPDRRAGIAGAPGLEPRSLDVDDVDDRHQRRLEAGDVAGRVVAQQAVDRRALGERVQPEEPSRAGRQLGECGRQRVPVTARPRQLGPTDAQHRALLVVAGEAPPDCEHLLGSGRITSVGESDGEDEIDLGTVAEQRILGEQPAGQHDVLVGGGAGAEHLDQIGAEEVVVQPSQTVTLGLLDQPRAQLERRAQRTVEAVGTDQPVHRRQLLLDVAVLTGERGSRLEVLRPSGPSVVRQGQPDQAARPRLGRHRHAARRSKPRRRRRSPSRRPAGRAPVG